MQEEYSDDQLLDQFQQEDSRNFAFNLLVIKYQRRIYSHIRRIVIDHYDTNDVIQHTF